MQEPKQNNEAEKKGKRGWAFWLRRMFSIILIFVGIAIGLLLLLLYNPDFQNLVVKRAAEILSRELQTKVELEKIDFNFNRGLSLEKLYVEDLGGDTLLFADKLYVSFTSPLLTLYNGNLYLDELELENADFRLQRDTMYNSNNLTLLLEKLQKPKPKEIEIYTDPTSAVKTQLVLSLNKLALTNVTFYEYNKAKGNDLSIHVGKAVVFVKETDLAAKNFEADLIHIRGLDISLLEGKGQLSIEEYFKRYPPKEVVYDSTYIPFKLYSRRFWIEEGTFNFDNERREKKRLVPPDNIDFDHLRLHQFVLDADSFNMTDLDFSGKLNRLSLRDSSGFELSSASADYVHVSSTELMMNELDLRTPYSRLGDTLHFTFDEYPAFEDFENRVDMNFSFDNTSIALRDIMAFEPNLRSNPFFVRNQFEELKLNGVVSGTVNNLRSNGLDIQIGNDTRLSSNFSIRDVTDPNFTFFDLRVNRLKTSMRTLSFIIPNFRLPANFYSLGRLDFSGNATGFYYDLVAEGDLKTEIGRAAMDMQFVAANGNQKAKYRGNLKLDDFKVDKFTGNSNFGKTSFTTSVENGSGLTAATAFADLSASVKYFELKGYTYKNIDISGQLNQNFFRGNFAIADDNIDLAFEGAIENMTTNPQFDLRAKVDFLDLYALNLSKSPLTIAGDFDVNLLGIELTKLYGRALIEDLSIYNGVDTFALQTLNASSRNLPISGRQEFTLQSEIAEARAWGKFDLALLPKALFQHLRKHHPLVSKRLNLPQPDSTDAIVPTDFEYEFELYDSKNLTSVLSLPIDTIRDFRLRGRYSNIGEKDISQLRLSFPLLNVGNVQASSVKLEFQSMDSLFTLDTLKIGQIRLGKKVAYELGINGVLEANKLYFGINASNQNNLLDELNFGGTFNLREEDMIVKLNNSKLSLMQGNWQVNPLNKLTIGKDKILLENFILTSNEQSIALENYGKKGLQLQLSNFDFSFINEVWVYKPLNFYGEFTTTLRVNDVFKQTGFELAVGADEFLVNSDNWGSLSLRASTEELTQPVDLYLHIGKPPEQRQLVAEGKFFPPKMSENLGTPNSLDLDVSIENYPLHIAEYFIGDLITDTKGRFDSKVRLWGPLKKPNIGGTLDLISQGSVFVNYLQSAYTIDPTQVQINSYLFDATGARFRDKEGNIATVRGGMTHDHLKYLGLDVTLTADRFLAMDTRKGDNELFYGKAVAGDLSLSFKGPLPQLDLSIDGRSLSGTKISIPFGEEAVPEGEESFIRFVEPDTGQASASFQEIAKARGLNIDMRVDVTEDALIYLIFDEKSGDVIEGRGNGNLQLEVTRSGEFNMYGTYNISEGEYLFTLYDLVNKPFSIVKDSRIRWTGDPYTAQVEIDAIYQGIRTPLTNLVSDYLVTAPEQLSREAAQPTKVDLILHLKGLLMQPDISFEFEFPELDGSLRNVVDSRLITLERNPNELNYQVFGLILTNSFLPSQSGALLDKQYVAGINTVSELLANQLSRYLTDLVSEIFTDVSFVTGVDLDIAANYYETSSAANIEDPYAGTEVEVASNFRLINDKVLLRLGGNYSQSNAQTISNNNQLFSYDVILELALTKDKRYKLRFYHRTEPEITGGLETRTGIGLAYRREFDSFRQLIKDMREFGKTYKRK